MIQIDSERTESEFVHVDWHFSGAFSTPDGVARSNYYNVTGAPTVVFDGYDAQVGAGGPMYSTYNPIVVNHLANDLGKLSVSGTIVIDAGAGTGTVTGLVTIADGEVIANPAECKIKCVVYEDDITFCCDPRGGDHWETLARDALPEVVLTADAGGETQGYNQTFTLNGAWNSDNLHAIVYVQRDTNKRVLNAGFALAEYNVELANLDPPTQRVDGPVVPLEWDEEVTYTGAVTDDVVVTLNPASLPAGWSAELEYNTVIYPSTFTIPAMVSNQVANFKVRIFPNGGPGLGTVNVTAEPNSQPLEAVTTTHNAFSNTPAILFVDDDQGGATESFYQSAISNAGYSAIRHNLVAEGSPTSTYLDVFDAVVWTTGASETGTTDATQETALRTYLDNGGRVFLSSHGFADERFTTIFSINYIRMASRVVDVGATSATGVAADPIGDTLALSPLAPPFTDRADRVNPGSGAVAWLNNQSALPIALRYDNGTFRTVFMAAAFEGISTSAADPNNQDAVMERILDWLLPNAGTGVDVTSGVPTSRLQLSQNRPNPFTSTTSMSFALPKAGQVDLSVFDVSGRRVATIANGTMEAGTHSITWDGKDASGRSVATGVYLARLESAGEVVTQELVRVK